MNFPILTTEVRSETHLMLTRQRGRQIAILLGFDAQDQTRIATAVSEIARNAVQHAGGGKVAFLLASGTPQVFKILVSDHGPGISDLESILNPGCVLPSQPGDTLRGVRRLMDEFSIDTTPASGTTVCLAKHRPRHLAPLQRTDICHITDQLIHGPIDDPLEEMQRQNQELLHILDDLRGHQEEIAALNARLKRSVQATHHRTKNNLQIISALVELQLDSEDGRVPVAAMMRIGMHSRSLAALHDLLTYDTKADAKTEVISVKAAMDKLVPLLEATAGGRRVVCHVDDFQMPVGKSASLALLISELVSNGVKHGETDVDINMTATETTVRLEVCNDGRGFPPDFDWSTAANTGMNIIDSTVRSDLNGRISYGNRPEGGARVVVEFPVNLPEQW